MRCLSLVDTLWASAFLRFMDEGLTVHLLRGALKGQPIGQGSWRKMV